MIRYVLAAGVYALFLAYCVWHSLVVDAMALGK
jgi:hypothetical protein